MDDDVNYCIVLVKLEKEPYFVSPYLSCSPLLSYSTCRKTTFSKKRTWMYKKRQSTGNNNKNRKSTFPTTTMGCWLCSSVVSLEQAQGILLIILPAYLSTFRITCVTNYIKTFSTHVWKRERERESCILSFHMGYYSSYFVVPWIACMK